MSQKKIIIFVLMTVFCICFSTVTASAETLDGDCGADGDNVKWTLDTETGELIIYGEGEMKDFTPLALLWHGRAKIIQTIVFEGNVTSIGNNSFRGCVGIGSIEIPSSVRNIGNGAFYGCIGLTSVTIPRSVTRIGGSAFFGCNNLNSITILSSVACIGKDAFSGTDVRFMIKEVSLSDRNSSEKAAIHGYRKSTAEAYAKIHNITFVPLEDNFLTKLFRRSIVNFGVDGKKFCDFVF